jgi:hypothetical protein
VFGISRGEDGIRVVYPYDLTSFEGDLAIRFQLRNLAAVKFQRVLSYLHDTSHRLAIDVVTVDLRISVHGCLAGSDDTHGDFVASELACSHLPHTNPGSWELELQVLWHNDVDAID